MNYMNHSVHGTNTRDEFITVGTQGQAQLGPAVPRHGVLDDLRPAAGRNEVRQRELLLRHGDVGARLQAEHLRGE